MSEEPTQDQFGGDYTKLSEGYNNIRALQSQTAEKNNQLNSQVQELQNQINKLKETPTPTPPANTGGDEGVSFDWDKGEMRLESGDVNPDLVKALAQSGMKPEHVQNFLGYIEDGVSHRQYLNDKLIQDTAGSKEGFDAYVKWGQDNLGSQEFQSIAASLNDRNTSLYAMQGLMAKAKAGGFEYTDASTPSPSPEPGNLPPSTGGGSSVTPLVPNTPEAMKELQEALGDPAKMKVYTQRISAGLK
jgi:hypothetical protein